MAHPLPGYCCRISCPISWSPNGTYIFCHEAELNLYMYENSWDCVLNCILENDVKKRIYARCLPNNSLVHSSNKNFCNDSRNHLSRYMGLMERNPRFLQLCCIQKGTENQCQHVWTCACGFAVAQEPHGCWPNVRSGTCLCPTSSYFGQEILWVTWWHWWHSSHQRKTSKLFRNFEYSIRLRKLHWIIKPKIHATW